MTATVIDSPGTTAPAGIEARNVPGDNPYPRSICCTISSGVTLLSGPAMTNARADSPAASRAAVCRSTHVVAEMASIPKGISTSPMTIGNSIITLPRSLWVLVLRLTRAPSL